jgi:hypothetical protein
VPVKLDGFRKIKFTSRKILKNKLCRVNRSLYFTEPTRALYVLPKSDALRKRYIAATVQPVKKRMLAFLFIGCKLIKNLAFLRKVHNAKHVFT